MNTPLRISPIHDCLKLLNGHWREINGMPTLAEISNSAAIVSQLAMADLSFLTRFGVKGAGAAGWLENQGISVRSQPNTWCPLAEGSSSGIVARLGMNEFLIEDGLDSTVAAQLTAACQSPPPKVYPVLRQDLAIALTGESIHDLLLQTCNVNVRALSLSDRPIVLTSMVGIAVTMLPDERNGVPFYRIWCDGTFGAYLWQTLLAIVEELGGGVVGAEQILDLP